MKQKDKHIISISFFKIIMPVLIFFSFIIIVLSQLELHKPRSYEKLDHIEELYGLILNNYHSSVSEDSLITFLSEGLLSNLDPFTQYISQEELMRVNEDFSGDFYGIGVQFTIIRDTVVVIKVIDDGPSQKANILAGDRIISVDGEDFTGEQINNTIIMNTLRGKRGEKVELTILRNKKKTNKTIHRDAIPLNSIESAYLIKKNVGYLKLEKFSATTYNEFKKAISNLKKQGATKLILDLRNNGGGYLQQAVKVVNEFLEGDLTIVSTEGEHRKKTRLYSDNKGIFKTGEIVVLINENSASASEILAGAIQDHDRGVVIGNKSFGKGLVQEQIGLNNGGAFRITVAKYYTPSGRCIQKPYHFSDTIVSEKKFKTKGGREVFSEGGITPDHLVLRDTMSDFESSFWANNHEKLHEKSFDFAHNNRSKLQMDHDKFLKTKNDFLWKDIISLSEPDFEKEKMLEFKNNFIDLFKKMILGHILTTEDRIYYYNKDDEYIKKALEILLI